MVPVSPPAQAAGEGSEPADASQYAILDLELGDGGLTAQVTAAGPCLLAVVLCTESGRQLGSGIRQLDGGLREETVELVLDMPYALPDYFVLRGFLLDEGLAPLCNSYYCQKYTRAYEQFMDATVHDFEGQTVLNFDQQEDNNFAVLAQGVLEISCGGTANRLTVDEGEEVYTIAAPDSAAAGLRAGDRVVLYDGGQTYSLVVDSARRGQDGSVILTSSDSAQLSDFFSCIKLDWEQDLLDESVEVTPLEGIALAEEGNSLALLSSDRDNIYSNSLRFELERALSDHLSMKGALTLTTEIHTVFHYSAGSAAGDLDDYLYVRTTNSMEGQADLSLECSLDNDTPDDEEYEIPLARVVVPVAATGLSIDFQLGIPLEVSLTGTMSLSGTFSLSSTVISWKGSNRQTDYSNQADLVSAGFEGEGKVHFGVRGTIAFRFLGSMLVLDSRPEFGVELTAKSDPSLLDSGALERHMCQFCFQGEAVPFCKLPVRLISKIGKWKITFFEYTPVEYRQEGQGFYLARHTDGTVHFDWGTCPNIAYQVKVLVSDSAGTPLAGATVDIRPVNEGDFAHTRSDTPVYLHEGTYTLTAQLNGYQTKSMERLIAGPGTISISLYENDVPDPDLPLYTVSSEGTHGFADYTIYTNGLMAFDSSSSGLLSSYYRSYPWQFSSEIYNSIQTVDFSQGDFTRTGRSSFQSCANLGRVILNEGINFIDPSSFYNCKSLTDINFPFSITHVSSEAFRYCENLRGGVYLPNAVEVGSSAFESCASLEHGVILPKVQEVGSSAFAYCGGVTSAYIGGGTIGNNAFNNCHSMTSLSLGDVTSIGSTAFAQCTSLTRVELPDTLTTLGSAAFASCTGLTSITVPGSVAVPGDYPFSGCTSLTSATLEDGVTVVSDSMFIQCTSLKYVYLPGSIHTIERQAFRECTGLQRITLPDGVGTIESHAFYGCSALRQITIPTSVTSIGDHVFDSCPLTDVYYNGSEAQWNAIDIHPSNTPLDNATIHFAA